MANLDPNLIVMIAAGAGFVLLLVGILLGRTSPSVVEERLGRYSETGGLYGPSSVAEERERPSPLSDFFNQLGEGTNLFDQISRHLARADLKFRPAEYIFLIINSGFMMGFIGLIVSRQVGFAILLGLVGLFLPPLYVMRSQRKRLVMFDNQLGDMLNFDAYKLLNEQAKRSPPGAQGIIFLPHFVGAGAPNWNPDARGVILGLALGHGRADLIRAIMEGTSFEVRQNLEIMRSLDIPM